MKASCAKAFPSLSPAFPKAIFFDCDGTLLLTSGLHFKAISATIARHGGEMLPDWYLARAGLGRHDLFSEFAAEYSMDLDLAEIAAESIAMTVALAHEARENPLVAEVARKASGRLPIAVVTNSETAIAGAFLDQTGLRDLFDLVLTCDDVARPKPAPDLYLLAAERFGVSPQDCLVLEDSDQGVGAARSAGMAWHDVRSAEWPPNCAGLIKSLSKR